jgi:hypothetical protein
MSYVLAFSSLSGCTVWRKVYFGALLSLGDICELTWAESSSELFWSPVVRLSVNFTFSISSPEPLGQF